MTRAANLAEAAGSGFAFRNRIINGDMRIDQRNAGAAVTLNTSSGTQQYIVDRWVSEYTSSVANYTMQQVSDAPSGFSNSLKLTVGSSNSGGFSGNFKQNFEGYGLSDLAWGSASAIPVTVSFWAKSSVAGTYSCWLRIPGVSSIFQSFTLTANVWTYVSLTFTGSTANALGSATNGEALVLRIVLGNGGRTSGSAGVWGSGEIPANQTNLFATSGATFQITGVQLEKGTVATPFEFRPYGAELALCQRYYQHSFPVGTAPANGQYVVAVEGCFSAWSSGTGYASPIVFCQEMRAIPTMTFYNNPNVSGTAGQWGYFDNSWMALSTTGSTGLTNKGFTPALSKSSAFTRLSSYLFSGQYAASAEL